jgi:hypothetical protein
MSATRSLPPEFADLNRFVEDWALATERERYFKLLARDIETLRLFFDAMLPKAREITAYLSRFRLGEMPDDAQLLYDLLLTFVETAHPLELKWTQTNIENTVDADRLQFHGPSAARYS